MSEPKIKVYETNIGGVGGEITQSCKILRCDVERKSHFIMVDCGATQEADNKNFFFPLDGTNIDAVIVSHAHADHFMSLPLLRNYRGKVYATKETLREGTELLIDGIKNNLRRSAEENGMSMRVYWSMISEMNSLKKGMMKPEVRKEYSILKSEMNAIEMYSLFNNEDVENIMKHFVYVTPYAEVTICDGISFRLLPTPHINGATSIELYVGDKTSKESVNIAISGDIGPHDSLFYKTTLYEINPYIKYACIESTHGISKRKESTNDAYRSMRNWVSHVICSDGVGIGVVLSLDRSAQFLYNLNKIVKELRTDIPIFFDSQLAQKELMHYQQSYQEKNDFWFKDLGMNPFDTKRLTFCKSYAEHLKAIRHPNPKICISSGAFGYGGMVTDYFERYAEDSSAAFLFTSWLPEDSPSYRLVHHNFNEIVDLNGKRYVKKCFAKQTQGFTSHGFIEEYERFIERYPNILAIDVVHGDSRAQAATKKYYEKKYPFKVFVPDAYDAETSGNSFFVMDAKEKKAISSIEGYEVFAPVFI